MSYFKPHNMTPPPKKRFNLIYIDDTYNIAFTKRFTWIGGWGYWGHNPIFSRRISACVS